MILHQLSINNFGIYSGQSDFDLSPIQRGEYDRPIIIVRGKNGVGKSTVLEAIRLCFHGALVLGSRVARVDYLNYLDARIHRPSGVIHASNSASVTITFDYVLAGRKALYEVTREWHRRNGKVTETLSITEDGDILPDVADEQAEAFLREVLPPSSADVFFFDSERLYALADDETNSAVFAETLKGLLGLHLVDRLVSDLNVFLSRQTKGLNTSIQTELDALTNQYSNLESERDAVISDLTRTRHSIDDIQKQLERQEQRIASEGNAFSTKRTDLKQAEQRLAVEIEKQRNAIQDLTSGLMPFAIAPQLCEQVRERLALEEEHERQQVSNQLLLTRIGYLEADMQKDSFWIKSDVKLPRKARQTLLASIRNSLERTLAVSVISDDEVILRVSDKDRNTLLNWIDQALTTIPERFVGETRRLRTFEEELKSVKGELSRIPADDVIRPLMENLNELNQTLGSLNQQNKDCRERLRITEFELEQMSWKLRALHQRLADSNIGDRKVQMAATTQLVLEDYEKELLREKLHVLEQSMVARFNDLCRKESFLNSIEIDLTTFQIILHRNGRPFSRNELSAGEKQLLATAQMWSLREISGLPVPVVIDTPVGRLDTDHRLRMIRDYFPRASHQVILLTTDAEIDEICLNELAPNIARLYDLEFDTATGTTSFTTRHFDGEAIDEDAEVFIR